MHSNQTQTTVRQVYCFDSVFFFIHFRNIFHEINAINWSISMEYFRKPNTRQLPQQQQVVRLPMMPKLHKIIRKANMAHLNWFNHKIIMLIEFLPECQIWLNFWQRIRMKRFGFAAECIRHGPRENNAFWYCVSKAQPFSVSSLSMMLFPNRWWNTPAGESLIVIVPNTIHTTIDNIYTQLSLVAWNIFSEFNC